MAYTIPTASELKAAFPAFAAVPDATVDFWIERATRLVDQTWFEEDYTFAIMLLACHYMVGAGLGTGAEAEINAQGMSAFQTIRSGQLTLSKGATSQSDESMGEWAGTIYGKQFYWLLRRNKPGGAVAIAPVDYPPAFWPGPFLINGRFP